MAIIIRQYGLLAPINWGDDCFEHLYLQTKLWNRLVEIEKENRQKYCAIIGADSELESLGAEINALTTKVSELDAQRKELRQVHRSKSGLHTEPLDLAIKSLKERLKELYATSKKARAASKDRIKASSSLLSELETERKSLVKAAYNNSGLWWSNYNAVINSYNNARSRALKDGGELNFRRFNGTGRFRCQVQGGMTTAQLLNGGHSVAQLQIVSNGEFADLAGKKPPTMFPQKEGSKKDRREYGILSITVYTYKDENAKHQRRMLEFPVIIHRPLPEDAILKEITVNRKKVGTAYQWSVAFTFSQEQEEPACDPAKPVCGINLGWKQVEGGLRIATIADGAGYRHLILPRIIADKLDYVDTYLKSRIDIATNDNFTWIKSVFANDNLPERLLEVRSELRHAKVPHPAKFAKAYFAWKNGCPEFCPEMLSDANERRKAVKRLSLEHANLRARVLRRRQDFYRNVAKQIAEKYRLILLCHIIACAFCLA